MNARFRLRPNGAQQAILMLVLAAALAGSTSVFAQTKVQEEFEIGALDWSVVKFKIGQYRDYMPFTHALDVDW